jgi:hypothetical protein
VEEGGGRRNAEVEEGGRAQKFFSAPICTANFFF